MSFKRHRQKVESEISEENFQEIIEIAKEEFPLAIVKEINPAPEDPEQVSISANMDTSLSSVRSPKPVKKSTGKKRVAKKQYTNIGVIGDTIVCRDFRAIVKKKGLQINNVLTDILHQWNTVNYNL